MHHFLSRPDWLADVNENLAKRGSRIVLDFDTHFVLVENDWASGYEPEDVAERIAKDEHPNLTSFKRMMEDYPNAANA